jgi:GH15 family glucan-1,4-alpha-glucosidase
MNNLNYGVIGNCRSAALISEGGSIDWCCLPDFDSPSVFAKLLDKNKGGYFSIAVDRSYKISQKYIRWTNVLCTEFRSEEGVFESIDFMPRYKLTEDEYFAPAEIYRYLKYISGSPSFKVQYFPVLNYAREGVSHSTEVSYIKTYSTINPIDSIYLYSSLNFTDILESRQITLTQHQFLLLSHNQKLIEIDINRVYLEFQRTKVYWLNWTNRSKKHKLYNDEIIRSLLVLKIMSFQPTGAILAALTTSIPESIGSVRNWDYRFCWLRDASMLLDTMLRMGHYISARNFIVYLKSILKSKNDSFQIMYGIRGERELNETELPHLAGYENSKPVRIGNAAYIQKQNDVFGYLLNVIFQYYEYFPGTLDEVEDIWEIVRNITRTVAAQWKKPDKSIWEIRTGENHYVFSKVMSWVAMDRAAKIASALNKPFYFQSWSSIANEIKEDIFKYGWNEHLQTFTQTYSGSELDASLLLMAEYGFIPEGNMKYRKTVIAVKNSLFHNGLVYRYTNEDDFGKPESSFTICTFWLIQALFKTGRVEDAREILNNLLKHSNHLGLFSEDIDFKTKRLLGNFPQAYSHLGLINSASLFSEIKIMPRFIKP